jgi:hypothetical protein
MEIYAIQIGWDKLWPWDAEKYRVWEITALVLEKEGYSPNYKHSLNKKIRRKKEEDMIKIVEKWAKHYKSKGYKVVAALGCSQKFLNAL